MYQHRKHWAVCCHLRSPSTVKSDTDTNYVEAENIYNHPKATEENAMTVSGDDQPLPENHTPYSLAPRTPTTLRTFL